jgi:hypothetical protein
MKTTAITLVLLGVTSANSDNINFSYMKKKEMGVKDDFSILSSVSNWFSGTDGDEFFDETSRNLQSAYQFYDANYGIMSDTAYQTYYNYATGDLYNSGTGENYNYNTNLYTYYSTTTTSSIAYSKYYQPPVYTKIYIPPVYSKVDVKKNQDKKKTNNKISTGTRTTTSYVYVPKTYSPDGTICSKNGDCSNYCCSKNLVVMPRESIQDLYNLRP